MCSIQAYFGHIVFTVDKCSQPAKEAGSCYDYVLSYSYVSSSGHCESFYYGGCEGSDNRFESAEDCEAECMRAATTRRPHGPTERPDQPQTVSPIGCSLCYCFTCALLLKPLGLIWQLLTLNTSQRPGSNQMVIEIRITANQANY